MIILSTLLLTCVNPSPVLMKDNITNYYRQTHTINDKIHKIIHLLNFIFFPYYPIPSYQEHVSTPTLDPKIPQPTKRRNPTKELDGSGPIVVIIRHGKTEYNKLGLFTGTYVISVCLELFQ